MRDDDNSAPHLDSLFEQELPPKNPALPPTEKIYRTAPVHDAPIYTEPSPTTSWGWKATLTAIASTLLLLAGIADDLSIFLPEEEEIEPTFSWHSLDWVYEMTPQSATPRPIVYSTPTVHPYVLGTLQARGSYAGYNTLTIPNSVIFNATARHRNPTLTPRPTKEP